MCEVAVSQGLVLIVLGIAGHTEASADVYTPILKFPLPVLLIGLGFVSLGFYCSLPRDKHFIELQYT